MILEEKMEGDDWSKFYWKHVERKVHQQIGYLIFILDC